jgi:hypothetical protein
MFNFKFNILHSLCNCLIHTCLFPTNSKSGYMLLFVSAEIRSHLHGATSVEGMYSILYVLSNIYDKVFVYISVIT